MNPNFCVPRLLAPFDSPTQQEKIYMYFFQVVKSAMDIWYSNDLIQECDYSCDNVLELLQSWTKSST